MTTPSVTVRWPGGERTFSGDREVSIGRSRDCDVVLDSDVVSRRHGRLEPAGALWRYVDDGSSRGSWVDGDRVPHLDLSGPTTVLLGAGPEAVPVELVPEPQVAMAKGGAGGGDLTALPPTSTGGRSPSGGTAPAAAAPSRPGGPGGSAGPGGGSPVGSGRAPATALAQDPLVVEVEGRRRQFYPGQVVRIGREDADVTLTEPTVSRRHATVAHEDGAWILRDEGSTHGTHVGGQRVEQLRLAGPTEAVVGSAAAGARVLLVPDGSAPAAAPPAHLAGASAGASAAGPPRQRRTSALVLAGIAVVAVLAVGLGAAVATGRLGGGGLDRDALARATVQVNLDDGSGGSGTIVDAERGLVLTNAHVAAPRAMGAGVDYGQPVSELSEEPSEILVAVAAGLDRTAENRFRARVVAADGYLDLAVLQLVETTSGALVTAEDLEGLTSAPLGDSADLSTGDAVNVLGYPALAGSAAGTLTSGVVSGSVPDPRLGTNQAWLNFDAAIAGGNSGGMVADEEGRLIGVPTLTRSFGDDPDQISSMRPVNLAKPLIEAAQEGRPYEPEHMVTEWPRDAAVTEFSYVLPTREGFVDSCDGQVGTPEAGDGGLALALEYENFPVIGHQDLMVRLLAPAIGDGATDAMQWQVAGQVESTDFYPVPTEESGCLTATLAVDEPLAPGQTYRWEVYGGPNYAPLGSQTLVVQ